MNWRRLLLALPGLTVFGVAVVVLLDPTAAELLPVGEAVSALGFDYLLVAIVGAAALVVTLLVLGSRAVGGIDQSDPPAPEGIEAVPRFGSDVDAIIEDGAGLRAWLFEDEHERIRERFHETAVGTVMRVSDCSRAEARARVSSGTWTDDPEAAAFLGDRSGRPGGPGGSDLWRSRFLAALSGETPFQRGVRRSAEAIVAYAETGGATAGATVDANRGPESGARSADERQSGAASTAQELSA